MTRTVAVTGGTGFIGRHVIGTLLGRQYAVRALTRRPQPPLTGVAWISGDLDDRQSLAILTAGADALVHCAGAVRGVTDRDFERVNVGGWANLLDVMNDARRCVPTLLVSSLAARHPQLSPYARSKRRAEDLLRSQPDCTWGILRPPAVYGPGDRELAPVFGAMAKGLGVYPRHAGRFSLLYVTDLADAIACWLRRPASGGIFELHDGHANGYSWPELLTTAERSLGRRIRGIPVPRGVMMLPAWCNAFAGRVAGRWLRPPMITPGKVRELYFDDWVCSNDVVSPALGWWPQVEFGQAFSEFLAAR